jgi:hypothetical protein
MAGRFESVDPGDVISSELMNYVLTKLREHEQRFTELEAHPGGTGMTISEIIPHDQEAAGRPLELRGTNFIAPPEQNTVLVGGVRVTSFLASTPTFLRFVIPSLPVTPQNVDISVENANGKIVRAYRVTPEIPVVGSPPAITDVRTVTGSAILRLNQPFVITGANFASQPNNNVITLRSRVAGFEAEVFPVTNIDTTQTTTTQIRATVPGGVVIHDPDNGDLMQLSLTVGAQNPVERFVTVK